MSLALVQDYSSEEDNPPAENFQFSDTDEDDNDDVVDVPKQSSHRKNFNPLPPAQDADYDTSSSSLPSAFQVFSQVTGPPEFLKNSMYEVTPTEQKKRSRGSWQTDKERHPNAVLEAKAQLVGIQERVRSDIAGSVPKDTATSMPPPKNVVPVSGNGEKQAHGATMPPPQDAANLLRMCLQCGVPKTYSNAKEGMLCPVCRDRPIDTSEKEKKKGSAIKDKEKSKRMRGQSSHATWKSETEMHLRQQFD